MNAGNLPMKVVMKKLILPYLILVITLSAAAYRVYTEGDPRLIISRLVYPPTADGLSISPMNLLTFLPQAGNSVHAATLARLQDGTIACAWFSGSREGAKDVAIYFSLRKSGLWSKPRIIASPLQTQRDTARYVRKVGNPVLSCDAAGRFHLWYVSTSLGGWSTSALNHRISQDGGLTWSRAERLVTAPFFNLSTLVRTLPLPLIDGGFILPSYHELFTKHGEMIRLAPQGTVLNKQRLPAGRPLLQPAVAPISEKGELLALMRNDGREPRLIAVASFREDEGRWLARQYLPIANPNSSLALLRLKDGRMLMACNPIPEGRYSLSLFLSSDLGLSWQETFIVENSPVKTCEYSYPTLLQDKDGMIHLVYTWNRRKIAHRMISPAMLTAPVLRYKK
jgi:predicted neuraminidase